MQPLYWSIDCLPGMMPSQLELLKKNQITDTKQLLQRTRTIDGKRALARQLQLNQRYIDKWTALADLARIPTVGNKYCGLLLHAGIISVVQLSLTPFNRLHRQIVLLEVSTLQKRNISPSVGQIKKWVEEAKILSRSV